ncbi:aconitate hydratase AcnA [Pasteuria penetrans]|uniref:aconitate hydratase AcnA n=1 Tax=Pasteuria penetrans TaxID=86005 RepID=UPI0011EC4FA6|nr:aconitate hydratase AcnA [Pasteuria penetrans]
MDDYSFARSTLSIGKTTYTYYDLPRVATQLGVDLGSIPFSLRIVLEAMVRQYDGKVITEAHITNLLNWQRDETDPGEVAFRPSRIVLQDFTGVPAVVDLAALRSAVARRGGDPARISPAVSVDLVIDHSVIVDRAGTADALNFNVEREFARNEERYRLLRWASESFANFRVVPPSTGIVHQVNLEYLARVVSVLEGEDGPVLVPDTLVGTDSHTTMINGLGVLGWGVGGIEAEACMLGHPLFFAAPKVIGVRLQGSLSPGATATDLALTVTEMLRAHGVVGKFVEFFGPGFASLSLADRATVANMAPEYGATTGFFPVDQETLRYLRDTGRSDQVIEMVQRYCEAQGLFWRAEEPDPKYSTQLELDLGEVVPSLSGPKRPQDRVALADMKKSWCKVLTQSVSERGFGIGKGDLNRSVPLSLHGQSEELRHGSVVIAAITSCTNTSNPSVMLGAGLLAKKAVERGLRVPAYVKCSLTPGSKVVTAYLEKAGLLSPLQRLGFYLAGYGCATCIGNSGPLEPEVEEAIHTRELTVAAVLSGNRNFEGRIHSLVKANYLASPPLVVAYALAGTVDIDLLNDPIGEDAAGHPIYFLDLWPSGEEVEAAAVSAMNREQFQQQYSETFTANEKWNELPTPHGLLYAWDPGSTYIQEPPFFTDKVTVGDRLAAIHRAHILVFLGDSVTTDHISPAGAISSTSPAGKYLQDEGVSIAQFNSYGSRRGNDRVMTRGTFANLRIRNLMVPEKEGGYTRHFPSGEVLSIYDAAMRYRTEKRPLVILAGTEYGTGSSRDWAAKGTFLLGVRAVIAQSFERIHRSNLVGMGVLPLEFLPGDSAQSYGFTGEECIDIPAVPEEFQSRSQLQVTVEKTDGSHFLVPLLMRLDSAIELSYYRAGGILPTVLGNILQK